MGKKFDTLNIIADDISDEGIDFNNLEAPPTTWYPNLEANLTNSYS